MWWNRYGADTGTIASSWRHASLLPARRSNTADICEFPALWANHDFRFYGAAIRQASSVGGHFTGALTFSGVSPPSEIVGETGKSFFKSLPSLADGRAAGAQHVRDRPDGKCAGNHHHTHLGKCPMPEGARPDAR